MLPGGAGGLAEDAIITTYEKLKQEGEIIGLQKGARRVLLRLPGKRFRKGADHLLPLLQELTTKQQDELSEKILDATSLEEIHAWLKSIRGN